MAVTEVDDFGSIVALISDGQTEQKKRLLECYAQKNPTEFYQYDAETGERSFKIPNMGFNRVLKAFRQSFWDAMPEGRSVLLVSGPLALIAARVILRKKKTTQKTVGQDAPS